MALSVSCSEVYHFDALIVFRSSSETFAIFPGSALARCSNLASGEEKDGDRDERVSNEPIAASGYVKADKSR